MYVRIAKKPRHPVFLRSMRINFAKNDICRQWPQIGWIQPFKKWWFEGLLKVPITHIMNVIGFYLISLDQEKTRKPNRLNRHSNTRDTCRGRCLAGSACYSQICGGFTVCLPRKTLVSPDVRLVRSALAVSRMTWPHNFIMANQLWY